MIGIVGGGIAGLAAAYRLQRAGHEVTVFEAGDAVGGLAATYPTDGDRIERFYHHLSRSERTIVELAEDLGIGDRVEWRIGENAYYVDGVVHPLDTPWEILAYPHLSLYDTFRLGMLTLGIDLRRGIPCRDTYERLEDFEDVPVEEFVVEHTTRGVYDRFFEPLLDAKFGNRKADVSAAWLLGRVRFRGERDLLRGEILGYFDGGFGVLVDELADAVGRENVVTDARVTDVGFEPADSEGSTPGDRSSEEAAGSPSSTPTVDPVGGTDPDRRVSSITIEHGDGDREVRDVDAVVVATMPNVLEELTGYACDVEFQGTVCSVIAMDRPLTGTYWLNVDADVPFGALIEHTEFVPPDRYGGDHLLYVPRYVQSPDDPIWQLDDDGVEERWLDGIETLFPDFDRSDVKWIRTARNPRTAPIYERGYLEKVIPYDLGDAVADGLYYAGMATRAQYPERSLDGGVVAGFECADRIVAKQ